jgi:hypothetical protein
LPHISPWPSAAKRRSNASNASNPKSDRSSRMQTPGTVEAGLSAHSSGRRPGAGDGFFCKHFCILGVRRRHDHQLGLVPAHSGTHSAASSECIPWITKWPSAGSSNACSSSSPNCATTRARSKRPTALSAWSRARRRRGRRRNDLRAQRARDSVTRESRWQELRNYLINCSSAESASAPSSVARL